MQAIESKLSRKTGSKLSKYTRSENYKEMNRINEIQQKWAMEPLDKVDLEKIITDNFDGTFTNLDPDQEELDINDLSRIKVQDEIQPKITKEVKTVKKTLTGKPLPDLRKVHPKLGVNMQEFFENFFQTINPKQSA